MENSARDAMSKGIVPLTSETLEPNQQHGDLKDMHTVQKKVHWRGGEDADSDSDIESDLNGRKEQGKLPPDKGTLSVNIDRTCNGMNRRDAKL
jgi:hypothetical protein